MIRPVMSVIAGGLLLLLSACVGDAPPALDQAARTVIAQIRAGDIAGLKEGAAPEIATSADEPFQQIRQLLPSEEPDSISRIGYNKNVTLPDGPNQHTLTYEYNWPDRASLIVLMFLEPTEGARPQIQGVNINTATRAELATLNFNFFSKTLAHYGMLLALAVSLTLMVAAFVMSIRTPGLKRRWLWCISSLATVCAFTMDWSSGAVSMGLLNFGLINSGIARATSQFAPWYVSTSIPLGAIIVLLKLRKRRNTPSGEIQPDAPTDTPT